MQHPNVDFKSRWLHLMYKIPYDNTSVDYTRPASPSASRFVSQYRDGIASPDWWRTHPQLDNLPAASPIRLAVSCIKKWCLNSRLFKHPRPSIGVHAYTNAIFSLNPLFLSITSSSTYNFDFPSICTFVYFAFTFLLFLRVLVRNTSLSPQETLSIELLSRRS